MPPKPSRATKSKPRNSKNGLWIAPRYHLKTGSPPAEWDTRPSPNRLIELADTALELWELSANKSKGRKTA